VELLCQRVERDDEALLQRGRPRVRLRGELELAFDGSGQPVSDAASVRKPLR
jgi:hypothetical protein